MCYICIYTQHTCCALRLWIPCRSTWRPSRWTWPAMRPWVLSSMCSPTPAPLKQCTGEQTDVCYHRDWNFVCGHALDEWVGVCFYNNVMSCWMNAIESLMSDVMSRDPRLSSQSSRMLQSAPTSAAGWHLKRGLFLRNIAVQFAMSEMATNISW